MNVFVVEDSSAMRQRLLAALEELPEVRVVGWAEGADDAMAAIRVAEPHFVVLDLQLAQGSGLFVLGTIKELDPPPVVAVLSNYPQDQYRKRCAELGADFFFDKAEGLDALLAVCRVTAEAAEPRA